MSELYGIPILPCPWCGDAEALSVEEGTTFRWLRVTCGCGICGPEARMQTIGGPTDFNDRMTEGRKRAIHEWNARTPPQGQGENGT